jgi:hypothetical protein
MHAIGQSCIYIPNGSPCEIIRLYADRHRAAIKITETGREIDEVAWHDIGEKVVAEAPTAAPVSALSDAEEPTVYTPVARAEAPPVSKAEETDFDVEPPTKAPTGSQAAAEEIYWRRKRGESGR